MSNIIKTRLVEIFKTDLPEKTTNFHTVGNTAVFVVTDFKKTPVTQYVEVEMTPQQVAALRSHRMHGSFGWALQ